MPSRFLQRLMLFFLIPTFTSTSLFQQYPPRPNLANAAGATDCYQHQVFSLPATQVRRPVMGPPRGWLTPWGLLRPWRDSFSTTPWLQRILSWTSQMSLGIPWVTLRWENPGTSIAAPILAEEDFPESGDVQHFYKLTRAFLHRTPLLDAPALAEDLTKALQRPDIEVLVKYEPDQQTGSYKPRGVLADVMAQAKIRLDRGESLRDVVWVTESTGNHGRALAWAVLKVLPEIFPKIMEMGGPGHVQIYVPSDPPIPAVKRKALEDLGAEIVGEGRNEKGQPQAFHTYGEARQAVLRLKENRPNIIHVEHDSPNVMAGHGGILLEIAEQLSERGLIDENGGLVRPVTIIAPAGSFGMVSGLSLAAHERFGRNIRIVAAQSQNIKGGVGSLRAGRIIENASLGGRVVLEDGTAVDRIGPRAFQLFRRLGHAAIAVRDVAHGVRKLYAAIKDQTGGRLFEGSVGDAVQALYEAPDIVDSRDGSHKAGVVILILSGGNTDEDQWAKAHWQEETPPSADPGGGAMKASA